MSKKPSHSTNFANNIILYIALNFLFFIFIFDCMHAWYEVQIIEGNGTPKLKTQKRESLVSKSPPLISFTNYGLLYYQEIWCTAERRWRSKCNLLTLFSPLNVNYLLANCMVPPSTSVQANVFHINLLIEQEAPTLDIARAPLLTLFSFLWKY